MKKSDQTISSRPKFNEESEYYIRKSIALQIDPQKFY